MTASFVYDGDGRRVKSIVDGETILFVGGHYEIKNPSSGQEVTKYYFAGASRIAMRKYTIPQSMEVEYFLTDHLGSTNITTDTTGAKVSEMRYKPWGEVRYSWASSPSTTPAYELAKYTFTGQYSYMDDPSTTSVTEGFGLMFYNARWYDPYLNHFTQPDSIVPDPSNSQDWNRYSYARNNPLKYTDPSGHSVCENGIGVCTAHTQADQISNLTIFIKDRFDWSVKGNGWTLKELKTIYQTGSDISKVLGGDDYLRRLLGSVDLDLKGMYDAGLGDAHHVWLNSGGFTSWTVAHELGHSLDADYGWHLSKGLEKFTGGITPFSLFSMGGPVGCDSTAPGCNEAGYIYGGIPPKGSDWNFNRKEDFAESFAALVYPDQARQTLRTDSRFRNNPALQYDNYLTTPRGMWMSAIVYLLSH